MRISFLLRVDAEALAEGRLTGEIEEVLTGRIAGLRTVDDLVGFCREALHPSAGEGDGGSTVEGTRGQE